MLLSFDLRSTATKRIEKLPVFSKRPIIYWELYLVPASQKPALNIALLSREYKMRHANEVGDLIRDNWIKKLELK